MGKYIVYKYTSPNGGVYYGQTNQSLKLRAGGNGYQYLRTNKETGEYNQPLFAKAIIKYGWRNFKSEILYTGLTSEEADEKERELIKEERETGHCYNICDGGKGVPGTKEHKVKQYNLEGELIKTWDSIKEAEEYLGIESAEANIVACCLGRKKRAYGYIWRYFEDEETPVEPLMPYRHPILQYTKLGKFVAEYKTIREASLCTGVSETGIGNNLHGRAKSAGTYVWKFSTAPKYK